MSQQENDNTKKDFRPKDLDKSGTVANESIGDTGKENVKEDKIEDRAFSKANHGTNHSKDPAEPDDHLEKAMIDETNSIGSRAERQQKEKDYSEGHEDELETSADIPSEIKEKDAGIAAEKNESATTSSDKEEGAEPSIPDPDKTEEDLKDVSVEPVAQKNETGDQTENFSALSNQESQKEEAGEETPAKKSTSKPEAQASVASTQEDQDKDPAQDVRKNAQSEFEDSVAEDSEDESTTERHGIEKKDYHSMSKEELLEELEKLVQNEKIQAIKEHVEEIRAEFNAKFDEELEEKKEDFLTEGGNIIDFHYSTPLKKQFNSVYFDYKEKRNFYYQQLKQDLNKNLSRRLEIIEELKGLLDMEENINTTYKHFKDLQDKWKTAGAIPRDKYNTVWNTYHHHVENFYDFLHLNREFRDMDFKYNLEQKLKVIDRAEELTQEPDTSRAFRELQMLHKMWKEELGPVAKEYREDIWEKFSEATKKIHDQRQSYYDQLDQQYEKNFEIKQEINSRIAALSSAEYTSHHQWQQKIKELETLREMFFKAGKIPREKSEATWSEFKENVRQFNRNKNAYYKGLKKEQYENLEKKKELIKIAEDNKDNEDLKATTPLMKKIQLDWKKIGHVPRKDSDKIWKQFKTACNHFFERLHKSNNEENSEEAKAFEQKKEILDSLKSTEFSGEKKTDLPKIKAAIEEWKNIGRVPYNKRFIEGKFNKLLDQLFSRLDVDTTKAEMMKYENKVQALNDADDDKKLRNEHYFLTKKVEETKAEIRQLENNLQFFSNVNDDNPLVREVHKNIEDHKEQLKIWKEKLEKIRSLY